MGTHLLDGLKQLEKKHKLIGDVRARGLMLAIELVKDRTSKEYATEETAQFMELCKDKGILLGKGGLYSNVIRIAPPLSISKSQCDQMLKVFDEVFSQMGASV